MCKLIKAYIRISFAQPAVLSLFLGCGPPPGGGGLKAGNIFCRIIISQGQLKYERWPVVRGIHSVPNGNQTMGGAALYTELSWYLVAHIYELATTVNWYTDKWHGGRDLSTTRCHQRFWILRQYVRRPEDLICLGPASKTFRNCLLLPTLLFRLLLRTYNLQPIVYSCFPRINCFSQISILINRFARVIAKIEKYNHDMRRPSKRPRLSLWLNHNNFFQTNLNVNNVCKLKLNKNQIENVKKK